MPRRTNLQKVGKAIQKLGQALQAKRVSTAENRIREARALLQGALVRPPEGEYPWGEYP